MAAPKVEGALAISPAANASTRHWVRILKPREPHLGGAKAADVLMRRLNRRQRHW
jgi:hypothetical protein